MPTIRLLITGADGFVGRHAHAAAQHDSNIDVRATARRAVEGQPVTGPLEALDIEDGAAVQAVLQNYRPTHVLHLAAVSSPVAGAHDPLAIWRTNVTATLGLAHAMLAAAPNAWLMFAGSGLVYGATARSIPMLDESARLAPANAYAATKAAADLGLGALVGAGLKTIRFRPFNHTGAGQSEAFAIPAFAAQIARIEAGTAEPIIRVGDLSAERDFLDVHDVVAGYMAAITCSHDLSKGLISGTVLNLASGVPRRMQSVLDQLLALSQVPIRIEIDPARMRPGDIARYVGDASAAQRVLGWTPQRTFDTTLTEVLADQRRRIGVSSRR